MKKIEGFLLIALFAFISCSKEYLSDSQESNALSDDFFSSQNVSTKGYCESKDGMIVLGERSVDPYSLDNMQEALDMLLEEGGLDHFELEPTDYYVRFLPADIMELSLLNESGLILFDYPLDYDILVDGNFYHDPSIPEDKITWQYTVIKPSMIKGSIDNKKVYYAEKEGKFLEAPIVLKDGTVLMAEVIHPCYIPSNNNSGAKAGGLPIDTDKLMYYAWMFDYSWKNLADGGGHGPCCLPRGYVCVEDDFGGSVPVPGVRVVIQQKTKIAETYTDENGYYKTDGRVSFDETALSQPKRRVEFDNRKGFQIMGCNELSLLDAKSGEAYKYNFGRSEITEEQKHIFYKSDYKSWLCAATSAVAYNYYKDCGNDGICAPPNSLKIWTSDDYPLGNAAPMLGHLTRSSILEICSLVKEYDRELASRINKWYLPYTTIWCIADYAENSIHTWNFPDIFISNIDSFYNVKRYVFHELTHASHFAKSGYKGRDLWFEYVKHIIESYALVGKEYGDGLNADAGQNICELGEAWASACEGVKFGEDTDPNDWYSPAYIAIRGLLDDGVITRKLGFDCLSNGTSNIDDFYDKLINSPVTSANSDYLITNAFVSNYALSNQTFWSIYDDTGHNILLDLVNRYDKGYNIKHTFVDSTQSVFWMQAGGTHDPVDLLNSIHYTNKTMEIKYRVNKYNYGYCQKPQSNSNGNQPAGDTNIDPNTDPNGGVEYTILFQSSNGTVIDNFQNPFMQLGSWQSSTTSNMTKRVTYNTFVICPDDYSENN